jgi:pimeloyl-ACP methyl ester carboxylesterase
MAKHIVMVHGANEGGWCFDKFKGMFETLGWTCHAPDLIGHGSDAKDARTRLVGVGMSDYLAQLRTLLKTFAAPPVLLGHSMGGILVQQLAAEGLAKALILIAPAPRAGILPAIDSEKQLDRDMMSLGAFWNTVINPDFDLAKVLTLNCVPEAEQRIVFDKLGPSRDWHSFKCSSGCSTRPTRRQSTPRGFAVRCSVSWARTTRWFLR